VRTKSLAWRRKMGNRHAFFEACFCSPGNASNQPTRANANLQRHAFMRTNVSLEVKGEAFIFLRLCPGTQAYCRRLRKRQRARRQASRLAELLGRMTASPGASAMMVTAAHPIMAKTRRAQHPITHASVNPDANSGRFWNTPRERPLASKPLLIHGLPHPKHRVIHHENNGFIGISTIQFHGQATSRNPR